MHGSISRSGASGAFAPGTHAVYPAAGTPQAVGQLSNRASNPWSGTAVNTGARGSANSLYRSNGITNNRFAGNIATNGYSNHIGGNGYRNGYGNGRYHFPYRYYNYPYAYGAYYAPYLGYYGGYAGAYPYYADGTYSDIANGSGGYGNGAATVAPEYTDQGQDSAGNNGQQNPAPQASAPGQNGGDSAQGAVPSNGPDSLVEAVQQELIRRGYFGGKVDAMYGPDTKEALQKFQQDRHLAVTGLINEATLHALQLD